MTCKKKLPMQRQPDINSIVEESSRELRAILSPKQQKKFDDLMKQFRDRWRAEKPDHSEDGTLSESLKEQPKPTATPAPPGALEATEQP